MIAWVLTLSLLVGSSRSWVLESNVNKVIPGSTPYVQLVCRQDNTSDSSSSIDKLQTISRIRITRLNAFGSKENFADIRLETNDQVTTTDSEVISSGFVGQGRANFLNVTWATANENTVGAFGCDIIGYDKNNDFVSRHTKPILIKEKILTLEDVNKLVQSVTSDYDNKYKRLDSEFANLKSFVGSLEARYENITDDLREKLSACYSTVEVTSTTPAMTTPTGTSTRQPGSGVWPEGGVYRLVSPISGCPNGFVSVRQHRPFYLKNPGGPASLEGLFTFFLLTHGRTHSGTSTTATRTPLAYCDVLPEHASLTSQAWPTGSYCVGSITDRCPKNFQYGKLKYLVEHKDSGSWGYSTTEVCCRSDGSAHSPIQLPTEDAFYLYRYKGQCQQVAGMAVREDSVQLEVDSSLSVRFSDFAVLPDNSRDGRYFTLCYYYPDASVHH